MKRTNARYSCICYFASLTMIASCGGDSGKSDAAPVKTTDAPPASAPCIFNGATYVSGQSFTVNCITYVCSNGAINTNGSPCVPDAAVPPPDVPSDVFDASRTADLFETAAVSDAPAASDRGSEAMTGYDAAQADMLDAPQDPGASRLDASVDVGSPDTADAPIVCSASATKCNGSCVNLETDNGNCGSCGRVCPAESACTTVATASGKFTNCLCANTALTACGQKCTNVITDPANCGVCANACPVGGSCMANGSSASCQCPSAQPTVCNGACVDLQTSRDSCGACGHQCKSDEACSAGTCKCANDGIRCALTGVCTQIRTDSQNCGACGHACPAGGVCLEHTYLNTTDHYYECGCADSQKTVCSDGCFDLATDSKHCGNCNTTCAEEMSCQLAFVPGSDTNAKCLCNNPALSACNGKCVDTTSDAAHCGSCTACNGAGSQCIDSKCYGAYAMCVAKTSGCPWLMGANSASGSGSSLWTFDAAPAFNSLRTSLVAPSTMTINFEYAASADTCWNIPQFIVIAGTQTQAFPFPGFVTAGAPCNVKGTASLSIPIPEGTTAGQIFYRLIVGDYIISILVTSITFS